VVEQCDERVDVYATECACRREIARRVSDEELFGRGREEPDVCFDAGAAVAEGVVQGDAAPVVVVGVAGDGRDVLSDGEWDMGCEGRMWWGSEV
jgi:hypothetical protein